MSLWVLRGSTHSDVTGNRRVIGLYGLSGLVSLSYEVLWARMLSLEFGVSVFGVVVTVAAFMTGLGAGSLWWGATRKPATHPLRILAVLEGAVALFAVLLPMGMHRLESGLDNLATYLSLTQWHALMGGVSFIVLTLPAAAMGSGFALVVRSQPPGSDSLKDLYGINTLGAVLGALAPLVLLPWFGWTKASWVTAGLGFCVALGMWVLSTSSDCEQMPHEPQSVNRRTVRLLWAYGAFGAASLMLEVGWTRLFGLIMLRTEYVLAMVLAVFLTGIGLGSLLARRMEMHMRSLLPWLSAGGVLAGLALVPTLSGWVEQARWSSLTTALIGQGAVLMLFTLPVTLVLGGWLPLLAKDTKVDGVRLYGANSLGSALGALLAGLVMIPWLGTTATLVLASWFILGLGVYWSPRSRSWLQAIGLLIMIGASVRVWQWPEARRLLPESLAGSRDLYRYEDAIVMTDVVEQADGQRLLLTDLQRRDASTEPTAVFVQSNQGRLPLLLHPAPGTVLFEGLGTGISVRGSMAFPGVRRSAVELSSGAIRAAKDWFSPVNGTALQATTLWQDDARHFLSATRDHYDVIVGDLFHPDLAGASSLLTLQQFRRIRAHLASGGIFVQWIALNQFDKPSLDVVLRTFKKAFPDGQMFLDGMHLALVGPRDQWAGAPAVLANLQRMTSQDIDLATAGEGEMTWLGRYWGPIMTGAGPTQDEWEPQLEFRLPKVRYGDGLDMARLLEDFLSHRPAPEQAALLLHVPADRKEEWQRAYTCTSDLVKGWVAGLQDQQTVSVRFESMAVEANPHDRWAAYALSDRVLSQLDAMVAQGIDPRPTLRKLIALNARQPEVWRALWKAQLARHDPDAELSRQKLLQLSPLDLAAGTAKN